MVEAASDIGAHSVRDVLLVHGDAVGVVGAGAGYVDSLGFYDGFETVGEFRCFTASNFRISWVFKVEITQNLVAIRCR